MTQDMRYYYDYTVSPLGNLFYKTLHRQLNDIKDKTVLDFGSGFAFTSNFFAKHNKVVAVEYYQDMIDAAQKKHPFTQLCGDVSTLKNFEDESFDVVVLHLVLEFIDNQEHLVSELLRLLKKGGILSVVRHNRAGRIIQATVTEYNIAETIKLLNKEPSFSSAFGNICYYENEDLLNLAKGKLKLIKEQGVRSIASLCSAEDMQSKNWLEDMLMVEWELLKMQEFIDIAYFKHLTFIKV